MLTVQTPIPGADELITWFGEWPSFHDAEVVSLHLERSSVSYVRIHTWQRTNNIDSRGYYVLTKHVIVTFHLHRVTDLDLVDFGQNVIGGLSVEQTKDGYKLILWPCAGLAGSLTADQIHITFEPGIPPDSQDDFTPTDPQSSEPTRT